MAVPSVASRELPPSESISQLSEASQLEILDLLFEPCAELHRLCLETLRTTRFVTYHGLVDTVGKQLYDLQTSGDANLVASLDAILGSHPRLGEKKVDSAQSRSEQAHLKAGGEGETQRLAALNAAYEGAFPGLKYVVFVNGRPRSEIMDDIQKRIDRNDLDRERKEAIQAMCDIAQDRATKLLS